MPTIITHAVVALSAGEALGPRGAPPRLWTLAVLCAVLPDLDVIGFYFGLPFYDLWGHRGFSHSLFFALILSLLVALLFLKKAGILCKTWWRYWLVLFLASASHGILDALTNGGMGVALLAPFDDSRFFFSLRPIMVSPISLEGLFSNWGLSVMQSEITWVWIPCFLLVVLARIMRLGTGWYSGRSRQKVGLISTAGRSADGVAA